MSEQTTRYLVSSAYDQGFEDGVKQERERIYMALLSDEADLAIRSAYRDAACAIDMGDAWVAKPDPIDAAIAAALNHIGLGEETGNDQ